jgi:hypothetical protein
LIVYVAEQPHERVAAAGVVVTVHSPPVAVFFAVTVTEAGAPAGL